MLALFFVVVVVTVCCGLDSIRNIEFDVTIQGSVEGSGAEQGVDSLVERICI